MTELNTENVDRIFADCMFRSHEEYEECKLGELYTFVDSIQSAKVKVGFHPERICQHMQEIREMLGQLPDGFFPGKGGGASFLQAACLKNGDLWTGFHTEVEKLCLLGMASRQLRMLLPREEWHYLPGGMPYFVVEEQGGVVKSNNNRKVSVLRKL